MFHLPYQSCTEGDWSLHWASPDQVTELSAKLRSYLLHHWGSEVPNPGDNLDFYSTEICAIGEGTDDVWELLQRFCLLNEHKVGYRDRSWNTEPLSSLSILSSSTQPPLLYVFFFLAGYKLTPSLDLILWWPELLLKLTVAARQWTDVLVLHAFYSSVVHFIFSVLGELF